jgi:UDP-N-acetylglucosamine 2-epimerase (non-hydrolysing)
MLDQVLEVFKIRPDVDLDLMRHNQTLPEFTARAVTAISEVLEREEPNWVLIQGDTTTVMCTALAAFYQQIPVGHVEAGLRTHDRYSPFPEEINRHLTSVLATYHFAPTQRAQHALVAEGIDPGKIFVTGNTIVDAIRRILDSPPSEYARRLFVDLNLSEPISIGGESISKKVVLVTAHRRESFGEPFESLCRGIRAIADRNQNVVVIYPVHLNPKVRDPVNRILSGHPRVHLIDPVSYEPFVRLMEQSYIILTDSGGIQEEASVLGKPVLILRDTTERPEIVEAGIGKLVGADEHKILIEAELLLHNENVYRAMSKNADLFGDGHAAERIVATLMAIL